MQLIADAGGFLELQVARVPVHLVFQRLDPLGRGLGGQRRVVLGLFGGAALGA